MRFYKIVVLLIALLTSGSFVKALAEDPIDETETNVVCGEEDVTVAILRRDIALFLTEIRNLENEIGIYYASGVGDINLLNSLLERYRNRLAQAQNRLEILCPPSLKPGTPPGLFSGAAGIRATPNPVILDNQNNK